MIRFELIDKGIVPLHEVRDPTATHTLVAYGDLKSGDSAQDAHKHSMLKELKKHSKLVTLGVSKRGNPRHPMGYHMYNPTAELKEFVIED